MSDLNETHPESEEAGSLDLRLHTWVQVAADVRCMLVIGGDLLYQVGDHSPILVRNIDSAEGMAGMMGSVMDSLAGMFGAKVGEVVEFGVVDGGADAGEDPEVEDPSGEA